MSLDLEERNGKDGEGWRFGENCCACYLAGKEHCTDGGDLVMFVVISGGWLFLLCFF